MPIGFVVNSSVSWFMPSIDYQNKDINAIVEFGTKNNI